LTVLAIAAVLVCGLAVLLPGCQLGGGSVTAVNESTFDSVVLASKQPVLVDFSATWCGPCKTMEPVLEELAADFKGKAIVVKIDVNQSPNLTKQYGATTIPCFIVFKNGKPVGRAEGVTSKSELADMLKAAR
jgi:thioredoxin 1